MADKPDSEAKEKEIAECWEAIKIIEESAGMPTAKFLRDVFEGRIKLDHRNLLHVYWISMVRELIRLGIPLAAYADA